VFTGDLAFGASRTFSVSPPVRVQATDGSVTVTFDGEDRGALGAAGTPGSGTFVVR
jgi:cytoskeleton protein RodZ